MKVFSALEATPDRGREFAGAVRHLLQVRFPLSRTAWVFAGVFPKGVSQVCLRCAHTPPPPLSHAVGGRVGSLEAEQLPAGSPGAAARRGATGRRRRRPE